MQRWNSCNELPKVLYFSVLLICGALGFGQTSPNDVNANRRTFECDLLCANSDFVVAHLSNQIWFVTGDVMSVRDDGIVPWGAAGGDGNINWSDDSMACDLDSRVYHKKLSRLLKTTVIFKIENGSMRWKEASGDRLSTTQAQPIPPPR